MSMTLSNAAAAAKAAKADLTAPVAANNSQVDSAADSRAAQSKQASRNQAQNQADAPRRAPAPAPAPAPSVTRGAPASQAAQGGKAGKSAAADQTAQASDDSADDVVTTAPLFAQLLNLADLPVTGQDGQPAADAGDGAASDTGSGTATVSAADALSAITSGIATSPLPTYYAPTSAPAARSDGVNAISALNASATRLNLAAAGVAVTPAAQPGADATDAAAAAAATQAAAALVTTSAQAATPQAVYNQAGNAALAALAQNKQAEAPAAGAEAAVLPAPVETDASTPVQPVVSAAPRVQVRVTDSAAPAAKAPESATLAGAGAKDDSRATAASATTTTTGTVGFATAAPTATPAAAAIKLAGSPEQWQQPLREALGDRLQLQLQRNNDHAVIRLEPPNMGSIEISIRHSAGALQVNLSANNSEVVRQLNTIGDSVRQDLSTRQFSDVAVTVSSSRAQSQAQSDGSGGRSGQQRNQDDGRTPGRALSDEETTSTFAMNERE